MLASLGANSGLTTSSAVDSESRQLPDERRLEETDSDLDASLADSSARMGTVDMIELVRNSYPLSQPRSTPTNDFAR